MNTGLKKNLIWMTALLVTAILTLASPLAAAAQDDDPPGRVARLNYIQGTVSFQPAGEPEWVAAITNRPLTTGDRLWTDNGARAELHTGSAAIRLDSGTGFSFLNLDDRTVQIQLTEGTIDVRVRRLGRDEIFEIDTPNQAFSILRPGQYRIQAAEDGNSTVVTVRSGEGEVTGGGQIYTVRSGQSGTFTGGDSLSGNIYNAGRNDDFATWGEGRDRHYDQSQSARYVSHDVVGYEDLDDYGTWRSDPGYGNVWVPNRVSAEWAPYREGHWAWISPWGWTWVDDAPWGYAPFHYGRWVVLGGSWGWVPGPREIQPVYAPALVVFIGGAQFGRDGRGGNVGWFPLGPREVYVPGYNASRGYVDRVNISNTTVTTINITNVYNNRVTNNNTNITYVNRTARGGVTAVPQSAFTGAQPVARAAVTLNAQQIASAPVISRAEVSPTRNSVLGTSGASTNRVAQPPAAVVNRSVVAKAPPPPPPVPFNRQQQALAAHPGEPLARHEVESLRPANSAAMHPQVRQAPPGKPAAPNANRPATAGQPGNVQPTPNTANQPGNSQRDVPGQKPMTSREDRPPSSQPPTQPATQSANPPSGNRRDSENPRQPVNTPPPNTANQPGNSQRDVPSQRPTTSREDRPPSSQPPTQPATQPANPSSGNRRDSENPRQPVNTPPPNTANQPGNSQREAPGQKPMTPREDRPPAAPDRSNPPASANQTRRGDTPAQPAQPPDRRTNIQPPQPPKAEPSPKAEKQPNPPQTQAEKDREKQKKQEEKPPQ